MYGIQLLKIYRTHMHFEEQKPIHISHEVCIIYDDGDDVVDDVRFRNINKYTPYFSNASPPPPTSHGVDS